MISRALKNPASSALVSHVLVFARFGMVGATTAAVYFLVMWGTDSMLSFNHIEVISVDNLFPRMGSVVGMFPSLGVNDSVLSFNLKYITVVSVAYIVSTVFHYLANRHFTFEAIKDRHQNQIIRYLVMWTINYLITIVIVGVCVEQFQFSPYIGVCISVAFTMFIGYFLARYWVFKV
jgi:putative flippase GtrA